MQWYAQNKLNKTYLFLLFENMCNYHKQIIASRVVEQVKMSTIKLSAISHTSTKRIIKIKEQAHQHEDIVSTTISMHVHQYEDRLFQPLQHTWQIYNMLQQVH